MNERVFHAENARRLDDPERLEWLPPSDVIDRLGIAKGMNIADIGAGTGYFSLPFADAVGETGTVYAVDLQQEMLNIIAEKMAGSDRPRRVHLFRGEAGATRLPGQSVDLVFMANVWHELDEPKAALVEAARVLRPNGRLAILDWRADLEPPPGPPSHHRIPPERVIQTLTDDGWRTGYPDMIGRFTYLLIAFPS